MIREGILVLGLAATIFTGCWHFSVKAEHCVPFKIGGVIHVGDICR